MPPQPNPDAARELLTRVSPESWKLTTGACTRATAQQKIAAAAIPDAYKTVLGDAVNACTAEIVRLDAHCHFVNTGGKTRLILNLDLAEL
jgi:hypothetical protein